MIDPVARWRLLLGEAADQALGADLDGRLGAMDAAMSWLYGRDRSLGEREIRERRGGLEESTLTTPDWINEIHRLFPKETIERLERDALERFGIDDIVTNIEVLQRAQPNPALLAAVLRTKHLMNPEVLAMARKLVAEVVRELMEKLAREVRAAFSGTLDRRRRSPLQVARNLDFKTTLRRNLRHYQPATRALVLERAFFHARTRRYSERWQIILLVDQSGSMVGSVIHSAITAACLWGLPGMKTHLVAFDTSVVDLTADVTDPVELLMKVQLGGGTDIGKAVAYAGELIEAPRRTIVVLVSDFFEGADPGILARRVGALCQQGTRVLGLAALDEHANPSFDRDLAARLVAAGAEIGAMTPGQLAQWIVEKMGR